MQFRIELAQIYEEELRVAVLQISLRQLKYLLIVPVVIRVGPIRDTTSYQIVED